MDAPQIRPGTTSGSEPAPRLVAFFRNSSQGNLAIQLLVGLGVPADGLGVTPPDRIEGGQGMLLTIPCPDPALLQRVAMLCGDLGADVHRQRP